MDEVNRNRLEEFRQLRQEVPLLDFPRFDLSAPLLEEWRFKSVRGLQEI